MATAYDDILGKKAPEEKQTTANWQNTSSQPAQGAEQVPPVTVPVRQAATPVAAVQPATSGQTTAAGATNGQTSGQNTLAGTATGQTAVQSAANVQGTVILPNRPPVTAQNGQSSTGKVPQNNAPAVAQNAPSGHEVSLKTPDRRNAPKEPDHDRPLTYTEIYNRLNKFDELSPEEKARLEKKRKRDAIIAAIGDGISALANLGYTTQYAPNGYDPKNSLSAASYARWTKMWDDYNKNRDKYYTGLLKAREMDDAKALEDKQWQRMVDRDKVGDERYKAEQEHRAAREAVQDAQNKERFEYQKGRDAISDKHWNMQFALSKAKTRAASSGGGRSRSGGAGRGGGGGGSTSGHGNTGSYKTFGNYAVSNKNWTNDSYVNQLFSRMQSAARSSKLKGVPGALRLLEDIDKKSRRKSGKDAADMKRAAIEELFMNNYSIAMQKMLGGEMMDFDYRYNEK